MEDLRAFIGSANCSSPLQLFKANVLEPSQGAIFVAGQLPLQYANASLSTEVQEDSCCYRHCLSYHLSEHDDVRRYSAML